MKQRSAKRPPWRSSARGDPVDLDQVDAEPGRGHRLPSSQSPSWATEDTMPSGTTLACSSSSGRNLPVRTSTVRIPCALRTGDVALEVVADHPGQLRVGVDRLQRGGEVLRARLAQHHRLDPGGVLEPGDEGACVEPRPGRRLPPAVAVQAVELGARPGARGRRD